MAAPVPEGSIGFTVVAAKDRVKRMGGSFLEEEAEQGQLQSPARGATGRPGHGTEAASSIMWLQARGESRTPGKGDGASQGPPTELGPAHHQKACQSLVLAQLPIPVPGSGCCGEGEGLGLRREAGRVGEVGAFVAPSPFPWPS